MADDLSGDVVEEKLSGTIADGAVDDKAVATPADKPGDATADAGKVDAVKTDAAKTDTKVDTKTVSDWRVKLAGEDKELAKTLARYTDEAAFGKAHKALLTKLSSGEMKRALPEGATPEELATWRKENGLPDKPEAYIEGLELPNGLVLGEADKPIVADFAAAALEANVDPKAFSKLVGQYYAIQDKQRAAQEEADATFKQQSEDALRGKWEGPAFRQNLIAVQNLMAGWPEGLAVQVLAGRDAQGRKLGDNPAFIQQLATLARELNPAATLVPAGTTDAGKSVGDRIAEIRKFRSENPDKYEADKKMQAEELELIDAQLKMSKRNAA